MKRILVPTDFSPNANKALRFAVEIAKAAKAELLLINVCDIVNTPFREKTPVEIKYNLPVEDASQLELDAMKKNIEESDQLKINTKLYGGPVTTSILLAAEESNADLIILGTLGDTAFKEKLLGSITAAVIGKANIPVLAVPLLSEWNIPKNILLAINHFNDDPGLANPVFDLAKLFNAKITVSIYTDEDSAVAVDYLEHTRNTLAYEEKLKTFHQDTRVETGMLDGHKFQETLDEYIDENYVDILVMFTYKRSFIESIFNRSMTKKMSYHTNIPLLAIPVL